MRNWNKLNCVMPFSSLSVFIVPMRNWNKIIYRIFPLLGPMFLSYLWGIETSLVFEPPYSICNCFYRTYEELKLQIVHCQKARRRKFLSYPWGIETFAINVIYIVVVFVFIVPMRNWNLWKPRVSAVILAVFIVPMRNWNHFNSSNNLNWYSCFYRTYEELKRWCGFEGCAVQIRFYRTNEELKLNFQATVFKSFDKLFIASMTN